MSGYQSLVYISSALFTKALRARCSLLLLFPRMPKLPELAAHGSQLFVAFSKNTNLRCSSVRERLCAIKARIQALWML